MASSFPSSNASVEKGETSGASTDGAGSKPPPAGQSFSTANKTMLLRMQRELKMLTLEPPHGICAWPKGDRANVIAAQIRGPEGTPFEGGTWDLTVVVPDRYPFEPPKVQFDTPIYHPNIDSGGRICLDTLKMPPKGSWRPSVNLSTLLTTVRLLIATPNADDGLMPDITNLYKTNPKKFAAKARQHTLSHAMKNNIGQGPLRAESNNAVVSENKDTGNIKNESATDVTASSNVGEKVKSESEEEDLDSEESEEESEEEDPEEEAQEPSLKKLKTS